GQGRDHNLVLHSVERCTRRYSREGRVVDGAVWSLARQGLLHSHKARPIFGGERRSYTRNALEGSLRFFVLINLDQKPF
ncbi:hypothetical protein BGZ80_009191, partial [Entomortierella chlamydospora]